MFAVRQKKNKKNMDDRCREERGKARQKMEKCKYVGRTEDIYREEDRNKIKKERNRQRIREMNIL